MSTTLVLPATVPASADPGASLDQVRSQVRDLQHDAESASERYNQAREDLKDVTAQLASIRSKVDKQRLAQQEAQRSVEQLARTLYMSGTIDPTLQVLLTEDPAAFLAQASAMDHLAQGQQDLLRGWRTTNLRLVQAEAELADRQERIRQLTKDMKDATAEADAKLASAQGLLSNLSVQERQRLEELRKQERQQQAAQAQEAARQAGGGSGGGSESGSGGGAGGGSSAASGKAAQVVQFALAQVGKSYRAARTGPDSYDCSGLVLAAFRKVGVSLTHYSRAQYEQTKRVSMSQMRPGDLVFYFGRGAHHVAIYVGNGKMVSASNPDDGVELISFLGPWYRERFSGVGRVL
ncbi:MAG: C40 family peptidase [Actinomycetales bacterium]|nr:C40 family peptidase [Actinomycetales bacterium]